MREPVKTNKCENMRENVVTRVIQENKEIILICILKSHFSNVVNLN